MENKNDSDNRDKKISVFLAIASIIFAVVPHTLLFFFDSLLLFEFFFDKFGLGVLVGLIGCSITAVILGVVSNGVRKNRLSIVGASFGVLGVQYVF